MWSSLLAMTSRKKMEPAMDEAWKSLGAARRKMGLPEVGNG